MEERAILEVSASQRLMNYYNENDPFAAQWLRNLIVAEHIPAGHVDERSIEDVEARDLDGFAQCHFFAGIAGWSEALRLANWPAAQPVWTGSCPCQPLSGAGQRKGHADRRHLWPAFYRLIAECKPATVFGEQVAGKDGREWLSGVRADLEDSGYACGCADLCAASAGAPHIRQRLFWVANSDGRDACPERLQRNREHGQQPENGGAGRMAHAAIERSPHGGKAKIGLSAQLGSTDGKSSSGMGDTACSTGTRQRRISVPMESKQKPERSSHAGAWEGVELTQCADGKARSTQPGVHPLAHGVQGRVGQLRAYGNAIVPQVAAEFVSAYLETLK